MKLNTANEFTASRMNVGQESTSMSDAPATCDATMKESSKKVAPTTDKSVVKGARSGEINLQLVTNDKNTASEDSDAEAGKAAVKQPKLHEDSDTVLALATAASQKPKAFHKKGIAAPIKKKGIAHKVTKPKRRNYDLVPQSRTPKPAEVRKNRLEQRNKAKRKTAQKDAEDGEEDEENTSP